MELVAHLQHMARGALDTLLPPRCYGCGAPVADQGRLCPDCWSGLTFITPPRCACCGYPFDYAIGGDSLCAACMARRPGYDVARSGLAYDDASRRLVLAFKHGDRTHLAGPLAELMALAGDDLLKNADIILPVPLHPGRLFRRRFNQAALLAGTLARRSDTDWSPTRLLRHRATSTQGGQSRRGRQRNVTGAFRMRGRLDDRAVLLIDDVMTTGATVEACARCLRRAGARHIAVLTLARVVLPGHSPI